MKKSELRQIIKEEIQNILKEELSGKEVSKRMLKYDTMKAFAPKVAKMTKVNHKILNDLLPDYVAGKDITAVLKEEIQIIMESNIQYYIKAALKIFGSGPKAEKWLDDHSTKLKMNAKNQKQAERDIWDVKQQIMKDL